MAIFCYFLLSQQITVFSRAEQITVSPLPPAEFTFRRFLHFTSCISTPFIVDIASQLSRCRQEAATLSG